MKQMYWFCWWNNVWFFSGTRRDISIRHRLLSMLSPTTPFTLPTGTIDILLRAMFSIRNRNTVRDVSWPNWVPESSQGNDKKNLFSIFKPWIGSLEQNSYFLISFRKVDTASRQGTCSVPDDKRKDLQFFLYSWRYFGVWDLYPGSNSV